MNEQFQQWRQFFELYASLNYFFKISVVRDATNKFRTFDNVKIFEKHEKVSLLKNNKKTMKILGLITQFMAFWPAKTK